MKLRQRILRDALKFTGSHYTAKIFDIFKAIFVRRILGPLTMGLFSELTLVQQYARLNHLGILNALDREIPFLRGKREERETKRIESVAFTFCAMTAFLLAALLISIGSFLPVPADFRQGLMFIGLLIFMDSTLSYYKVLLRTHHEFGILSRATILVSVIETVCAVLLVLRWGMNGLFAAMGLANFCGIVFILCSKRDLLKIAFSLEWGCVKSLLRIGFPLSVCGIVRTIFISIDRILILVFLGRIYLGFYSIAIMVYNFATPLSTMVYNVIYPRFMEAFGKTGELKQVESYLTQPTLVFGHLYPVAAGVGVLFLPLLLHYLLPKFSPGLTPAQILLWSTCCFSLVFMWGYALIALEKQWSLVGLNLFAIVLEIGLCYLLTGILGWGLNGIAVGTFLAHFSLSILLIASILWKRQHEKAKCVRFVVNLYAPLAGAMASVWLIQRLIPYVFVSLWQDLGIFALQAVLLVSVYGSLVFFRLNQEVPVLRTLREWKTSAIKIRSFEQETQNV